MDISSISGNISDIGGINQVSISDETYEKLETEGFSSETLVNEMFNSESMVEDNIEKEAQSMGTSSPDPFDTSSCYSS